jgi:hypothetical protein
MIMNTFIVVFMTGRTPLCVFIVKKDESIHDVFDSEPHAAAAPVL